MACRKFGANFMDGLHELLKHQDGFKKGNGAYVHPSFMLYGAGVVAKLLTI